jgi:Orotidine 5'-phosphate decarboxylase / HUMPS family
LPVRVIAQPRSWFIGTIHNWRASRRATQQMRNKNFPLSSSSSPQLFEYEMSNDANPTLRHSYESRARDPKLHPLARHLLRLMAVKRTNLCLSADVDKAAELLGLAESVGESICVLKTHADIVVDWSQETSRRLKEIAKKKGFLIFEDRKFGDIGSKQLA